MRSSARIRMGNPVAPGSILVKVIIPHLISWKSELQTFYDIYEHFALLNLIPYTGLLYFSKSSRLIVICVMTTDSGTLGLYWFPKELVLLNILASIYFNQVPVSTTVNPRTV